MMRSQVEAIIQKTLNRITTQITAKQTSGSVINEQSGLFYTGNVHDAIPRQLFMDVRLSPLDKMTWVMIRLHAQQNEGAVFPTYNELQTLLASPNSGRASKETVSRTLLMLRLTGWLSLCKRVRDNSGRVRGNIYAQHDEPLGFHDAEYFDPRWLDSVAHACQHANKTVRLIALSILHEIQSDNTMRHRHSHVALIASRLSMSENTTELPDHNSTNHSSSIFELSKKSNKTGSTALSSESEPSQKQTILHPSSNTELSHKPSHDNRVRKSNRYVRTSFIQDINNTYVGSKKPKISSSNKTDFLHWPPILIRHLPEKERAQIEPQLLNLDEGLGQCILDELTNKIASGGIKNSVAYLLGMIKRAQNGQFNIPESKTACRHSEPSKTQSKPINRTSIELPVKRADPRYISEMVAKIRAECF